MNSSLFQMQVVILPDPFKAAVINIFYINKGSNTCNVKGVAFCDEPTENYHLTLQFPSAL